MSESISALLRLADEQQVSSEQIDAVEAQRAALQVEFEDVHRFGKTVGDAVVMLLAALELRSNHLKASAERWRTVEKTLVEKIIAADFTAPVDWEMMQRRYPGESDAAL
jgi:hypothetical protein